MSEMIITTTVDIHASAAEAWECFGERFADWATWAPGIESSALEGELGAGVVRVQETSSLGTVRQTVARFDRHDRALAYEMAGPLPPMFRSLRNDWRIVDLGSERCRLEGQARIELSEQGASLRDKLEGKMGRTLEVFAGAFRDVMQSSVLS